MVATYHGHEVDLNALRRKFSVSMKGTTLKTVLHMAQRLGMVGRGLRLEPSHLKSLCTPCILHWDMKHFVVLKEVRGDRVVIHDPGQGVRRYSLAEASSHFTGIALELTPTTAFEKKKDIQQAGPDVPVGPGDGHGARPGAGPAAVDRAADVRDGVALLHAADRR